MKRGSPSSDEGGEAKRGRKGEKEEEEEKASRGLGWKHYEEDDVHALLPASGLASAAVPSRPLKVAAFDLDSTLVVPRSGKRFSGARNDWKWWDEAVPARLREAREQGYALVVFTNQAGIEAKKTRLGDVCGKLEDLCDEVGAPMLAFVSAAKNHGRKPSTHMWQQLLDALFGDDGDDTADERAGVAGRSFYVGDAAGRAKGWAKGKPRDHSCSDRKFAANARLGAFHTPEEYFLGQAPAPFDWANGKGTPTPARLLAAAAKAAARSAFRAAADEHGFRPFGGGKGGLVRAGGGAELVVFCGPPASGKSTLCERLFVRAGYERVNQDTLGTLARCMRVAREALGAGRPVVVDNLNATRKTRESWLKLAREAGVPCRPVYFDAPKELAMHLNVYRNVMTRGGRRRLPDVVIHSWYKNHEKPTAAEGFAEGPGTVSFVPSFADDQERALFEQWT